MHVVDVHETFSKCRVKAVYAVVGHPAMDQQFYAALYEAEWQRRDQLQSSLSTPLGILVLVGTALTVLLQQFRSNSQILIVLFWPLFVAACAALAVAAYMVVRSFHGYVYSRIPLPSQIRDYHEGLRAHYVAAGYPGLADREFQLYLLNRYVEAADRNSAHNVNRGEYLHKANRALVAALVATALSASPFAPCNRIHRRLKSFESRGYHMGKEELAQVPFRPENGIPPKPLPPPNIDLRTGLELPRGGNDRRMTPAGAPPASRGSR